MTRLLMIALSLPLAMTAVPQAAPAQQVGSQGAAQPCLDRCILELPGALAAHPGATATFSWAEATGIPLAATAPIPVMQACNRGTGNSSTYNGYTVLDIAGQRIGTVRGASIDGGLRVQSVVFEADPAVGSGQCIRVGGVSVLGTSAIRTGLTAGTLRQSLADNS